MPESFDAYHKWLGIPADQQPADHYRLLGIGAFEADPDVIEAAANQRAAYLQELSSGQHVEQAQQLLNEVSQARRCLLTAERKRAYDEELRRRQPAAAVPEDQPDSPRSGIHPAWLIGGSIISLVMVVSMAAVMKFGGDSDASAGDGGTLVVRWPMEQRGKARLEIDGKSEPLPDQLEFEVSLQRKPKHRHHIVMHRPGFKPIDRTVMVVPGERNLVQPNWQKLERRRR